MIYPNESYEIIGAAMKVHSIMGPGFTEDIILDATFVPDFICYDKIIVELKAVRDLDDVHRSQAINYAKVAGYKLALLINFGDSSLEYERFPVG